MGASSFSKCMINLKGKLCSELRLLSENQVGEAVSAYVNQVGLHEQFLDEAGFKSVVSAMYVVDVDGDKTKTISSREQAGGLYSEMLQGSRFTKSKHDGQQGSGRIPALQALAALLMFCDPENSSMDNKLDALVSLCQFKYIPSERGNHFTHVTPSAMCSKAEFLLVVESVGLGITNLCCSHCSDAIDFPAMAGIASDIFRSSFMESISVVELRFRVTEHPKVGEFMRSFTSEVFDFVPLLPLRDTALRVLAERQSRYMLQANPHLHSLAAAAPLRPKGSYLSLRSKHALSVPDSSDSNANANSDVLLNWRECLNIVVEDQSYVNIEKCVPFDEIELEILVETLSGWGGADGTVSLKKFKTLNIVFLSYELILLHSFQKHAKHADAKHVQSLLPSSLSYLQRLFALCCKEIGLKPPDYVAHNTHIAASASVAHSRVVDEECHDLYDALHSTPGYDEKGNPIPRKMILSRLKWCTWCFAWLDQNETEKNTDVEIVNYFAQYATTTSAASCYMHDPLIVYDFLCEYLSRQSLNILNANADINPDILKQEYKAQKAITNSDVDDLEGGGVTKRAAPISVVILKDHIHYLAEYVQQECTEHPYGLSLTKIKHVSKEIKSMVLQFVTYYKDVHG